TPPITRAISTVGCTMSSISSLTARSLVSQPWVAPATRARWPILPSLPTVRDRRTNSSVMRSFSDTTSLKIVASSTSESLPVSGMRTEKSPLRSLRKARIKSRRLRSNSVGELCRFTRPSAVPGVCPRSIYRSPSRCPSHETATRFRRPGSTKRQGQGSGRLRRAAPAPSGHGPLDPEFAQHLQQFPQGIGLADKSFTFAQPVTGIAEARGIDHPQVRQQLLGLVCQRPAVGGAGHPDIGEQEIEAVSFAQQCQRLVTITGSGDVEPGLGHVLVGQFAHQQFVLNQQDFAHAHISRTEKTPQSAIENNASGKAWFLAAAAL